MSNTSARNVRRVDTTASFTGSMFIESIKYIGASSGAVTVTCLGNGNKLWEESGSSNVYNADLDINATEGVTVTITNSAVVYLYIE